MISYFRRTRCTIGVDIGSAYVKAVVIDHGGGKPVLTRMAHHPVAPGAIVDGEVVQPESVVAAIRGAVAALGVTPRWVVSAVGGRDIMIKTIVMDRMAQDDASEAIRWEAEQHVPFEMSSVQLDFQVLDPGGSSPEMSVLLVAAKRSLVEERMALLMSAGLEAAVVDVDAFALHNAFVRNYPHCERGSAALVHLGQESTTILIQREGVPVVNRDVAFGVRNVLDLLQQEHGLAADEAVGVLFGSGDRLLRYQPALDEAATALARHIERTLAFLAIDGAEGSGVSTLHLSGGGVRLPRLADVLSENLHARIEVANPMQRLCVHPAAGLEVSAELVAPMLMLAVGLGLRAPGEGR